MVHHALVKTYRVMEYAREPARSSWQRLKVKLMSWLSLDREL